MAKCKYCGQTAGFFSRVHKECEEKHERGLNYLSNLMCQHSDGTITVANLTFIQWHKEVAAYNVPLCLIPESIHPYAQKSISDWKNKYLSECDQCFLKSKCCGLFATSQKTI